MGLRFSGLGGFGVRGHAKRCRADVWKAEKTGLGSEVNFGVGGTPDPSSWLNGDLVTAGMTVLQTIWQVSLGS